MAIAWKAKYGYQLQSWNINLSFITFTDESIFSLPEITKTTGVTGQDLSVSISDYRDTMGDDISMLTTLPPRFYNYASEEYGQILREIPEVKTYLPNLWQFYTNIIFNNPTSPRFYPCVYIPSLKRVVVADNFTSRTNIIYSVSESGELSRITINADMSGFYKSSYGPANLLNLSIYNYDGTSDIALSIYISSLTTNSSSKSASTNYSPPITSTFYYALFPAGSAPEYGPSPLPPVPTAYTITIQAVVGGSVAASTYSSIAGNAITLTPVAAEGYEFVEYNTIPTDLSIVDNIFVMPPSDVVITPVFESLVTYSINVNNPPGGLLIPSSLSAHEGDTITLTQTLDEGYSLVKYLTIPKELVIENNTFIMPSQNVWITPLYKYTPKEPYPDYPPSGPNTGGNGTINDNPTPPSDPVPTPSLPTLSSSNTGFTRIYNPTLEQVQQLASYLWTDESVITTIWNHIKQFFENPMDAIIGFNLLPVPVPDGGEKSFALMYIDTGVVMNTAATQFVEQDCGTLTIEKFFDSYLDYSPYTSVQCFLPYVGTVTLDVDEVMGVTLQVKYRVDICSGVCVAIISVNGTDLYQYSGHCAINIPFSAADFSSYVNAAISVAKLASTVALASSGLGAAAAVTAAEQATGQTVSKTVETGRNPETGRQVTLGTSTTTTTTTKYNTPSETTRASFDGLTPQNVTNTAAEIITAKPHIEHSGSFNGNSGYLGVRRPFLIIKRPRICLPENYQHLNGYPCMETLSLGSCIGFTRVQQVILEGCSATNPEQAEILQLLKTGVYL